VPAEQLLNASVTELEFLYGPLRDRAFTNGALVYLRSPELSAQLAIQAAASAAAVDASAATDATGSASLGFIDDAPKAHAAQERLKSRLRDDHLVRIDGYQTVAQAAEDIQRILLAEVERLGRAAPKSMQSLTATRLADDALPRAAESAWLTEWANRATLGDRDNLLLLTGDPGSGKSSLLASWMRDYEARHPKVVMLFYPFIGGGASTPIRFIYFVLHRLGFDEERFAALINQDVDMQVLELHRVLAEINSTVIIIADGIDILGDERQTSLGWIPTNLSPQVKMLISSNLMAHETALAMRSIAVHRISKLEPAEADAFIQHYLARFGKRLPDAMRQKLISARLGGNPQFLKMALDELRVDASHEGLSERIASYQDCTTRQQACLAILRNWLQRAQASGLGKDFVRAVQELLASVDGLPEPVLHYRLGLNSADASRVLGFAYAHFLRPGGRIGIPDNDWRQALIELVKATPNDINAWRTSLLEALCDMPADLVDREFAAYEFARQFVTMLQHALDAARGRLLEWIHRLAFGQGRIWWIVERANEQLPMLWSALESDRDGFDAAFAAHAVELHDRETLANAAFVLLEYQIFWKAARACARRALDAARAANDEEAIRDCAEMLLKSLAEEALPHFAEAETLMHLLIDNVIDPATVPVARARQAAEAQRLFAKVALECGEVNAAAHFARQSSLEYKLLLHRLQNDDEEGGITPELLSEAAHANNGAARALRDDRQPQEAEAFYAQAIILWSAAYSEDNNRVLVAEYERADALIDCGPERYAEAHALLEHAISTIEDAGSSSIYNRLYEAYRTLRKLYDREGRFDQAIVAAERAIDTQRHMSGYLPGDDAPAVYDYATTLMRAQRYSDALKHASLALRSSVDATRPRELQFLAGAAGLVFGLLARFDAAGLAFMLIRAADAVIEARHRASGAADSRPIQMWRDAMAQTLSNVDEEWRALPVPPLNEILDQVDAIAADTSTLSAPDPTGSSEATQPSANIEDGLRRPLGTVVMTGERCPQDGVWQASLDAGETAGGTQRRFCSGDTMPLIEITRSGRPRWLKRLFGSRDERRNVEWVLTAYESTPD
jgi:tetratricopeptide (TPR) repeat protein